MLSFFGTNILALIFGTLISLAGFVSIVFSTDPYTANPLVFLLFYLTFFLSVTGIMIVLGGSLRHKLVKSTRMDNYKINFRQGVIIGLLSVILLMLQSQKLFLWWVVLPVIIFFVLLEVFFNTNRTSHAK